MHEPSTAPRRSPRSQNRGDRGDRGTSPGAPGGLALAALIFAPACLGPQISDEVAPAGLVLPAGSEVPSVYEDPELARQIDDNDGIDAPDGVVPRVSAFGSGGVTHYWDFGPAPDTAAPLFVLHRPTDDGTLDLVPHGGIIDALPGDPSYTPFWAVFLVPVTPEYANEIIPSVAALEEAQQLGLVGSPQPIPAFVNCPVVADGVELDRGDGTTTPPVVGFFRGRSVFYFDFSVLFGVMHPLAADGVSVPEAFALTLRKEGREPLSEPVRGVDITGDGDTVDTADILDADLTPEGYTPSSRLVNVTVPAGFASIDTLGEGNSEAQATSDLFMRQGEQLVPLAGEVISFEVTDELRNLPVDLGELLP